MLLFVALLFSIIWMTAAWLLYLKYKNATIVDLAWTSGAFAISVLYFGLARVSFGIKYIVVFAMLLWAFRLCLLIIYRIRKFGVDGRYKALDKSFENNRSRKYFLFFMFQGVSLVILTLPVFILIGESEVNLIWGLFSSFLILIGLLGVIVADLQLQIFIAKSENKGKVCEEGLWNYSRHPNYFFEWVYWCAIALFVLPFPFGYTALLCPIGLFITMFFVTGIPPTEKQALLTKKDAYKKYQKTTSPFFPWFKRN